jgi:hypothetical protein
MRNFQLTRRADDFNFIYGSEEIHQLETGEIPVQCLLKSVIKPLKLTRFSPAAGIVHLSTHQVKHLIHDDIQWRD